ncbi:polymer-forming cytoskeletal protein [candidate division WS5 bacterium]|uniref:Polymer-forming cytoskeletal protein n=1 Tax=candidate division WS5 bacterium TaxID=2093353 RepID=A0A419DAW5_9BACT|nr:MAG: polymer-forming cytoskeletal protein [candidate division WS5 bacterium]
MFEKEKKEEVFTASSKDTETVVGSSVKLKGNLRSDGDININGSVSGDVKTKASVQIGPNANVVASVKAQNVYVSGTVQGNIEASETLQISETGKVYGDIHAGVLSVSPGAVFSGKCIMVETKEEIELEPILEEEPVSEEKEETK